jgi:hypothetical protein
MAAERRAYGTGRLYVRVGKAGQEAWYGHWRVSGRQVKRRIGSKRTAATSDGLTRRQAEAELRRMMTVTQPVARRGERLSVDEVAACYVDNARRRGRKRSTCQNVESEVRVHLAPFFGGRAMDGVDAEDVLDLIAALEGKGLAPKTVRNVIGTLSALFTFAKAPQRGWVAVNPCEALNCPPWPRRRRSGSWRWTSCSCLSTTRGRGSSKWSTGRST